MFRSVITELSALEEVEAIALGGSRSGKIYDEKSDYDIYLYCTGPISEDSRRRILEKYCSRLEISNHFWELEDNGTFLNGIDFDILYRDLDSFAQDVSYVVEQHHAQNAYTTCMWHNLITCKILYDKDQRLTGIQQRFSVPYPEQLRENILNRGWRLLHDSMPAYDLQIIKAVKRNDLVSIQHRVTAFLETYFDMLFALNHLTHPGEKRLIPVAKEKCAILPNNFEENLRALFLHMYADTAAVPEDLQNILTALENIL